MSRRITLELPDEIMDRAERLASLTHREVAELLADAVSTALPPWEAVLGETPPIAQLSDAEVLKLTHLRLDAARDRRLSVLLGQQEAGQLTAAQRAELVSLIQVYEANLLRQAEALAEAVRRGLREPLSS
jgi:hypothetical protein